MVGESPTNSLYMNDFPRDYLVRKNATHHKIILHTSKTDVAEFNQYAMRSLDQDNDARRRSKDEAISIHIITAKLGTRLNIMYEAQICGFYGKPDFIIRLGKNLYIMVSTTRAVSKRVVFDQHEATRLMKKKLMGLSICAQNLECLVDEVVDVDFHVRPVLHILSPNDEHAAMCMIAYKNMLTDNDIDLTNIKIVITCVKNHEKLL
jgi:hypothetical protein